MDKDNQIIELKRQLEEKNSEISKLTEENNSSKMLRSDFTIDTKQIEELTAQYQEKEKALNDRLEQEIAKHTELQDQNDQFIADDRLNKDTQLALNLEMESIKNENKIYKKELNAELLKNLLMTIPSDKELLQINKKYNGYRIIFGFSKDKKLKIAWTSNKNISNNMEISDLEINDGILTFKDNNNKEISLDFDRDDKFEYDTFNNGCIDLAELAKKKKNIEILQKLQEFSKLKRDTHNKASERFASRNLWFLLPSILITGLSGICSFMSSSSSIPDGASVWLAITVGIMASISTFLQSFSGAMGFGAKSEGHSLATEEYDNILTIINFEINHPVKSLENSNEFYDEIKDKILEIKSKCKYQVPEDINKKYNIDQINYEFNRIKNDLLKDTIELKADLLRDEIEGRSKYDEINILEINKQFNYNDIFENNVSNKKKINCLSNNEEMV